MEEHQYKALTDHLVDGSTMEKVVKEMMQKLYEKCVPVEKREHVEKSLSRRKLGGRQKTLAAALFSLRQRRMGGPAAGLGKGMELHLKWPMPVRFIIRRRKK